MAHSPTHILGFDPAQNIKGAYGLQTRDQYVAEQAMSWWIQYTSGQQMLGDLFANTTWDRLGLGRLNPAAAGAATLGADGGTVPVIDPAVMNQFQQLAGYVADNWDTLPPGMKQGAFAPRTTSGGPLSTSPSFSADDQARLFAAGQNAADNANALAVANIYAGASVESSTIAGNAARDVANINRGSSLDVANIRAGVDREAIASTENIARLDRGESARQFDLGLGESARQFDLGIAEDRRQFNATAMIDLFGMGIELSRRPVDWLAYQFYLEDLNIPLSYLNMNAAVNMMGAIPPSGPSAAGPVIGGPAVIDGDTSVGDQAGIREQGFVTVEAAISQNPGGVSGSQQTQLAAVTTIENFGGVQAVEQAVAQQRQEQLPQAVGSNAIVDSAVEQSRELRSAVELPGRGIGDQTLVPRERSLADSGLAGLDSQLDTAPGTTALGAELGPPVGGTTGVDTGQGDSGLFTGPTATVSRGQEATASGAQNPQGNALLQQLAEELGIPYEELLAIVPVELLAGGATKEQIMQTPVVQSLINREALSPFRTSDPGNSKFEKIQALGIDLGIRGGQDVNIGQFLRDIPSAQDMKQGAIEATGLDFRDVVEQGLRSSPISNNQPRFFGTRRF